MLTLAKLLTEKRFVWKIIIKLIMGISPLMILYVSTIVKIRSLHVPEMIDWLPGEAGA